jgi:hypothetical protein
MDNLKLCKACNQIKNLDGDFYKAGPLCYQKYCKLCHNANRKNYAQNSNKPNHIKKVVGFQKIDEETRKKILHDISIKINYREIASKYKIPYQTLVLWKRKNLLV